MNFEKLKFIEENISNNINGCYVEKSHIEDFCKHFHKNDILTDEVGGRHENFDSFKIFNLIKMKVPLLTSYSRQDLLKKIRQAIYSHNSNVAMERFNRIKELEKINKKQQKIISECKEELLLNIILNKNPDKFLFDLSFQYDIDEQYEKKIQILELMIEKNVEYELAITTIIKHYMNREKNYEKCKKYALIGIDAKIISCMFLMSYNEFLENNFEETKKYLLMFIDSYDEKCSFSKLNMSDLIIYYMNNEKKDLDTMYEYISKIVRKSSKMKKEILNDIFFNFVNEKNTIEIFQIFQKICSNNSEIPKEVVNDHDVIKYINKCNLMSKNSECCICLNEDVKCIALECCHYFCTECYPTILYSGSCPSCRCIV